MTRDYNHAPIWPSVLLGCPQPEAKGREEGWWIRSLREPPADERPLSPL